MGLVPKHINALRNEDITHPKDLANFDLDDFDSVIQSVKGKTALPGLAQICLKQACDFFQYVVDTGSIFQGPVFDSWVPEESHNSVQGNKGIERW